MQKMQRQGQHVMLLRAYTFLNSLLRGVSATRGDILRMLTLPPSKSALRARSVWLYERAVDTCHWVPLLPPSTDTASRLAQSDWRPIHPEQQPWLLLLLTGQLAPLQQAQGEIWAQVAAIDRVERIPVALGFQPSEQARQRLVEPTAALYFAQAHPPPQFGEVARIIDGDNDRILSLASLAEDALSIWQQLSDTLKGLAAPAAWWPYDDVLAMCATRQAYEERRDALREQQQVSQGEARKRLKAELLQLDQAYKQAQALQEMILRQQQNAAHYQTQQLLAAALAQQLAVRYWEAYQATKATSLPTAVLQASSPLPAASLALSLSSREAPPAAAAPEGAVSSVEDVERQEKLAILSRLEHMPPGEQIEIPSFQEDRAIREASLAGRKHWVVEERKWLRYTASNDLAVYFSDPQRPMAVEDALRRLPLLGESTVLTGRIALGLWNLRRHDARLNRNGDAAIRYDEILEWRGVQKHSRPVYSGAAKHVSDGYPDKLRKQVKEDFALLQHYYLRGEHTVTVRNQAITIKVDGPYLRVGQVSAENAPWGETDVGVFISPGPWINTYEEYENFMLAQVDCRIFQLVPKNEQHELRLALYLVERWRQKAKKRAYDDPISMLDLLTASMIRIDRKHLTDRFADRIEDALQRLVKRQIIGSCECLTPVDRSLSQWGKDWLASRWRLLPPDDLARSYALKLSRSGKARLGIPSGADLGGRIHEDDEAQQ